MLTSKTHLLFVMGKRLIQAVVLMFLLSIAGMPFQGVQAVHQVPGSAARFPLEITAISVSPEPIVGQVVTLRIEVMSAYDEPDAAIIVTLPKGVELVQGGILVVARCVAG